MVSNSRSGIASLLKDKLHHSSLDQSFSSNKLDYLKNHQKLLRSIKII